MSEIQQEWQYYRVSQGVLAHQGGVLLVANDYGYPELMWSLPGGRLEPGEQHKEGLRREFLEETGLQVTVGELLYAVDSRSEIAHKQFVTLVFEVSLTAPEVAPEPIAEVNGPVKEVRFVPFAQVPEYIHRPSMGEGLLNYLIHGKAMPRYFIYPEYLTTKWQPLRWQPTTPERPDVP
ncbi:MAG: NUDIX hydrolase [Chloroflexi bacterium]|uniref:NUDIX hydrolase n=1 Tax=Candidatus Chlorohelix allophototropha TaxID=3003348 RepID=A0A8T7LYU0_9CHLR|nr:NUDIX hydrolase [Chloroflexota bacterium]WJW66431.1 NUDIX hydrolase [Chloroflexota bacterium L227-S17]